MKVIVLFGIALGVTAGVVAPFVADLHVYRATSAYSGAQFWLTFPKQPNEEELLDAIIYHEPLIPNAYATTQDWRAAQREHHRLFIKKDADTSILVMPYESNKDPSPFSGGTTVKGFWFTEPATRTEYPSEGVALAYALGGFLVGTAIAVSVLAFLRWSWYFSLKRISELAEAIKRKT
jgi:hypothetical protein